MVDELIAHVQVKSHNVETVFVGQAFTLVELISGEVGLALTPKRHFDSCIGASKFAGELATRNSSQLAQLTKTSNSFLQSIGFAAINAVLQKELQERTDFQEGDFSSFLEIRPEDNIAMIDYYTTKIRFFKGKRLTIFDDRFAGKRKDITILPTSMLKEKLPLADIVIFPPSFHKQIDKLRGFACQAREFVLVHPTTPPFPEPFFRRGVTIVGTMMITDPKSMVTFIMEGAGTTMFKEFCRKILFIRSPYGKNRRIVHHSPQVP